MRRTSFLEREARGGDGEGKDQMFTTTDSGDFVSMSGDWSQDEEERNAVEAAMEMREMLSPAAAGKEAEALQGGGGSNAEAVSAETGGER